MLESHLQIIELFLKSELLITGSIISFSLDGFNSLMQIWCRTSGSENAMICSSYIDTETAGLI